MRADRLAVLICVCFVVLALHTTRAVPVFEASDEAAHFLYVHHLLEERTLPFILTREAIAQRAAEGDLVGQWSIETHQPPAYYVIGAWLIGWTERADLTDYLRANELIFTRGIAQDNANKWLHTPGTPTSDTHLAVFALRLYSLALATATLWLIYRTAWLAFRSGALALTALALVASIHTYASIGASVNNDNLVTLLYTAGVWQAVRMWRYGIRPADAAITGAVVGLIALTKITGLALLAVIYPALGLGVLLRRYTLRQALMVGVAGAVALAALAGWWYVRNWSLYGDPLALSATQALWGRQFANPEESGDLLGELSRVGRSFWMMTGHLHQPVYGPAWLYGYALAITAVGFAGALSQWRWWGRWRTEPRSPAFILALAMILPPFMLATGTRSVDISYGRLLFPALVGFAPLLVYGWRQIVGRWSPVLVLPLAAVALIAPLTYLPAAYPLLAVVDAVPESATPLRIRTENGLTLLAYEPLSDAHQPGGVAAFDLYLQDPDPRNPALIATLSDPLTGEAVALGILYPGSAPTDALEPGVIYRAPLRLRLSVPANIDPLRQLALQLGWQTVLDLSYLPLLDADDTPREVLTLSGGVLIDPRYAPPAPQTTASVAFGDAVRLTGYTLSQRDLRPGEPLTVELHWQTFNPSPPGEDYVLTVQLLDATGALVAQADGDIAGYPSAVWQWGAPAVVRRMLEVGEIEAGGRYRLAVGWYRLSDLARLPVDAETARDSLWSLPDELVGSPD